MPGRRVAWAIAVATATLASTAAHAQYAGSVEVASKNRYRGTDLGDPGPVVRAGVTADATASGLEGAYAGVSGVWRLHDGDLSRAEALFGWSRRFDTLPGFASVGPDWGWDGAVHLLHYGGDSRLDFHELMLGLLAPGWSTRVWWSPHYFGGSRASLYGEINGSLALSDRWRLFAHAGALRYGGGGGSAATEPRLPNRIDGLAGVSFAAGPWDLRLMRNGRLSTGSNGHGDAVWLFSAGVAF